MGLTRDRFALWLTFILGDIGIILLAARPIETFNSTELLIVVMTAASMGAITLTELSGLRGRPPYAYLLNGLLAIYVAIAFNFTNEWPSGEFVTPVMALLFGYGAAGVTTYIAFGPD